MLRSINMVRQLLLAFILLFITYSAFSECKKSISSDKVMIFVDLNGNELEYKRMQEVACARGESLKVLPTNYTQLVRASVALTNESKSSYRICNRNPKSNSCKKSKNKVTSLTATVESIKEKSEIPSKETLEKLVGVLDRSGKKISNLTFSGHDGGGNFGGIIGSISKEDAGTIFRQFPNQRESIQSILLLGCYTGVTAEIRDWRDKFPNAKLIAGYDGQAPLGDKLAGHTYIRDILQKEAVIVKETDQKRLFNLLNTGVDNIRQLSAAVYVEPYCTSENPASYYYRPQKKGAQRFRSFDDAGCLKSIHEGAKLRDQLSLYISGEKEIPMSSHGTELRSIYNFSRENSHCFETENHGQADAALSFLDGDTAADPLSSPDQLMMLLFYNDMKVNFAKFFKDDLEKLEKLIAEMDLTGIVAKIEKERISTSNLILVQEGLIEALKTGDEKSFIKAEMGKIKEKIEESYGDDPELKKVIELSVFKDDPLTEAELLYLQKTVVSEEMMNKLNEDVALYHQMKFYKSSLLGSPRNEFEQYLAEGVVWGKKNLEGIDKRIQSASNLKQDLMTKFWIPNEQNIKQKSRKEILDNLTVLNQLLSDSWTYDPEGVITELSNVKNNMEVILNYRDGIPFSWHEITDGKPEAPARITNLFENPISYDANPMAADQEQDEQEFDE